MSPVKRRMTAVFVFTAIIMLAVGISAALYFFKIEKNEDYQNQLHFRELNVAAHNFRSSLEQFKRVGSSVLQKKQAIESSLISGSTEKNKKEATEAQNALEKFLTRVRASESLRHIELVLNPSKSIMKVIPSTGLYSLDDGYSYYADNPSIGQLSLIKVPTKDFLPEKVLSFPMVMITTETGEVIARKAYFSNSTNAADLQFKNVKKLLRTLENQQLKENNLGELVVDATDEKNNNPTYSGIIELVVSSLKYRIFIQPVTVTNESGSVSTYYLLGFVPLSEVQLDKLSVSSNTGLWILLLLLLLTAAIPILKIRFNPTKHLFTRTDISLFFAGTILLLGIVSIAINQQMFYSYLIDTKYVQAEAIFKSINDDFEQEFKQINQLANRPENSSSTDSNNQKQRSEFIHTFLSFTDKEPNYTDKEARCEPQVVKSNGSSEGSTIKIYNCISDNVYFDINNYLTQNSTSSEPVKSFVENVYRLNVHGVIPRFGNELNPHVTDDVAADQYREPVARVSKESFNFSDYYLGYRDYFKAAITCDLWFPESTQQDCKNGFFIERIKNITDARLSTQFAFSDFANNKVETKLRNVKSLSVKLQTFFSRILPNNFGYAVFDSKGLVLYHSDESKVILENILVETYGDENIQTLMNSSHSKTFYQKRDTKPVRFETDYRDARYLFAGGQMANPVPWKLVVFYQTEDISRDSLWMVVFSVSLSFGLLIIVILWNRFGTKQYFWSKLLSYNTQHADEYGKFAWIVMGGTIFCFFSMGLLVDLYGRISLWFIVCCFLITWLSIKQKVFPFKNNMWTHPLVPLMFLATIFGILFALNFHADSFSFELTDFVFFTLGSLFFAFTILHSRSKTTTVTKESTLHQITNWLNQCIQGLPLEKQVRPFRYSRGYVVYLASLLWLFSVVPANMFVNATNHFLLDFQAYNETLALESSIKHHKRATEDYMNILIPKHEPKWNVSERSLFCTLLLATCEGTKSANFNWIDLKETEAFVDPMINAMASNQGITGAIHQGFFHYAQSHKQNGTDKQVFSGRHIVNYNGNRFLIEAVKNSLPQIFLISSLLFLITILFAKKFIVHRIMGEHLPDNFRTFEPTYTNLCFEQIKKIKEKRKHVKVQLIRTPVATVIESLTACIGGKAFAGKVQNMQSLSLQTMTQKMAFLSSLKKHSEEGGFIVIKGLECLAFNSQLRKDALELLEQIDQIEHLNIILVCDIAPLFRLCKQHAYPGVNSACLAQIDEVVAWTNLLFKFEKLYNWNPSTKQRIRSTATVEDVLNHEGTGWPALNNIKQLFEVQAEKHPVNQWKPDQIIEFFASHAGPIYRDKWEVCTTDERFTLLQLANGASINPANVETLEQLVKRGYVYRDCGWFIVNESFRRFILFAELESTYAQWIDDTNNSTWQIVRVPILVAVLVLAGVVVIGSGQSFQSLLAAGTATLGLIPLLMKNLNLFKSAPTISSE